MFSSTLFLSRLIINRHGSSCSFFSPGSWGHVFSVCSAHFLFIGTFPKFWCTFAEQLNAQLSANFFSQTWPFAPQGGVRKVHIFTKFDVSTHGILIWWLISTKLLSNECAPCGDPTVPEDIFSFCRKLEFRQKFVLSKLCQKSTFALMESLFEGGFPPNLYPMCILWVFQLSLKKFSIFAKNSYFGNIYKCQHFAKDLT